MKAVTNAKLLPWTVGLAAALLLSLAGNAAQTLNAVVAKRTADLECEARIRAALSEAESARQAAAREAQTDVDARAGADSVVERSTLVAIVRERDRALSQLRRLQYAVPPTDPACSCRVSADRMRVLNGALAARAARPAVQSVVSDPMR